MSNVNLIYVPIKKLKTTTIGVYIHRELNNEDVSKNAILPHVLKQGSKLCENAEKMYKYLENLYGATLSAGVTNYGDDQILRFEAQTICDKYAADGEKLTKGLMQLLMSVIFEPYTENGAFLKSVIDTEKKNAKDRIESAINDKRFYASQRCIEEMCKGEAFSLSKNGTIEGIDKITPQNLYEYYKEMIVSSVIDIFVVGDADEDELKSMISNATADVLFKDSCIVKTELHSRNSEIKRIIDRMDVNQGKLSIGFTTGVSADSEDFFALMVMNSIFGAGAHSKLFNNVREKLSLAYYASSTLVKAKGLMVVNAGIEFENFDKAYNETLVQLDAVKNGEISELEYDSSINSLLNSYESWKDDPKALHGFMAAEKVYGTNYSIDYVKDKIKAVTKKDVIRVAKNVKLDTVYFLAGGEDK